MSDAPVRYELDAGSGVARLTIDRPDARNALNAEVIAALRDGLRRAGEDGARCLVLTGAGDKAFCAGGDLGQGGMMAGGGGVLAAHTARGDFGRALLEVTRAPCPTVARVNGHALGGGLGLAVACDITLAADHATFGTPEIRVGLFPMMIMTVIARAVGRKRALELMLLGDRLDAATAERWGLINRVVPAAQLDAEVARVAGTLAAHSPAVLRLGRRAFDTMSDMGLDEAVEYLNGMLTLNLLTDDAMEGIAAFLEKRPPDWKGR